MLRPHLFFLFLLFALLPVGVVAASDTPEIEISNISGVSGYEVGIFGAGFGPDAGTVTILGAEAAVGEWSDRFVRVTIPEVADGSDPAGLVLTTTVGGVTSAEFTVYTINPDFLVGPHTTFKNVSFGKPLALDGVDLTYGVCSDFVTGAQIDAYVFLTNYACRHDVGAKFAADSALGNEAIIAIDLGEPVDGGTYLFQFFSRSDWSASNLNSCPGTGYPSDYVIESSRNGTRGWSEPHLTVNDNLRGHRSHYITLPAGAQWVRMRVTDSIGDCRTDIEGRDFEMKEVRLFEVIGDAERAGRAFAIYGDSITANAFNAFLGAQDVNTRIEESLPSHLPFAPLGMSGRKASQISEDFEDVNELIDAFESDDIAKSALYWGFALGTNDMNLSGPNDDGFTNPKSQFNQFDEAIEADAVQWLIARGRVPILARMHDTNSAENGYGFLEAKRQILHATDRIAAKYRLIPGPDMYTNFRLNIERGDGNWIAGDGTHLANDGPNMWVDLWADALSRAFDNVTEPPPLPVATTTTTADLSQAPQTIPTLLLLGAGMVLLVAGIFLTWRFR